MTPGWWWRSVLVTLAVVLPAATFARVQTAPERFPHEQHAGLFPLCAGCHAGVITNAPAEAFPPQALCARCHDGGTLEPVVWAGYEPRASNVVFDHVEHAGQLAREGELDPGCVGCHSTSPAERMRVVGPPQPEGCLTCHVSASQEHLEDAECANCHVPLAASGFTLERVAALTKPTDHEGEAFLAQIHGAAATPGTARCATCHVRDLCTACHVDPTPPAIRDIPPAPPGMEMPPVEARYPLPPAHQDPEWLQSHGAPASLAACGTCHTRSSCTVCHQDAPPQAALALPMPYEALAPGAETRRRATADHFSAFFAADHGAAAASDANACANCHAGSFCAGCHQQADIGPSGRPTSVIPARLAALLRSGLDGRAPVQVASVGTRVVEAPQEPLSPGLATLAPGFHPADFVLRHSSAAYAQTMECANCHNVEAFCKTCHVQGGLAPAGRTGPGFHDAGPVWLLGHGQAARQGLESCASCHRQSDCVQCHSTVGAFHVNHHGPSFDAARGWARAPETCLVCHLGKPRVNP